MKVHPKRTILIVMVNVFGTTREDNPLKRTPLCSQNRNWTAAPMFVGYLYHWAIIQQCLNVWIFLGHFGCKLAVYALCKKTMVPWSPLNSFSCHNVHVCIFSIDNLKYVFESNFFN
ncbi:hypothetical protein DPMN_037480 [Dreissena polymorpha]|uniref:Uncharacterized protein n=1 Tax=Dreissena polymorpha TaxID=45954 RepID=A0A9D4MCT7_DREPO|nr:hypothetical protein DPMN_037480 [Dreissena polymorpha]